MMIFRIKTLVIDAYEKNYQRAQEKGKYTSVYIHSTRGCENQKIKPQ
jgi:hypothetical protein